MKRKKYLIVSIFLVIALTTFLIAGGEKPPAKTEEKIEKLFKVGILGPFSGPSARTGKEFKNTDFLAQ